MEEHYIPLTPALYESEALNHDEFIDKMFPYVDAVFLVVNFGMDQCMFRIIDRAISNKEIYYRRIIESETKEMFFTPEFILRDVCSRANISIEAISTKSRKREIVDTRYVYYRRCRELTRASFKEIGKLVLRDHATVMHGTGEAESTRAVIDLYNRLYGPAIGKPCSFPVSKPVLPYRSGDPREHDIPSGDSFVQSLAGTEYNRPYHSYTPHNQ